ncbi:short-subunit dehydrogenase [Micromonospora kangleipakensis]|uniref:Short-subunit dehydrogenase n=1 Tax=Micromonospora kangleipakensis TaxID=1077942 RepID=A0A4V6MGT5_9ACTN|nr:SDR family NAD(P)-dependent oxidoreductase [Micromonospora kangleipakensis]RZU74946.1 short-subunit dehydrogenase [Micromonospora kangleipakensis]
MATSLFVTGASSGIGAAFLEQVPADVNEPHTFSRRPADGRWTQVDLGHQRQWETVVSAFKQALDAEQPDHAIFFHCSGGGDPVGRVVDLDPLEYGLVVTMNAASGIALGQAFLRACHLRGMRATLVLTGSPAADKDVPGMAHYCAAKDGMQHWGRIVAMEMTPESGNRVITVVPYAVLTEIVKSVMTKDPDEVPLVNYFRHVETAGEFASPETCARHIWTAIHEASNGAVVPVGALVIAERAAAAAS